jgi:hypothetical protein
LIEAEEVRLIEVRAEVEEARCLSLEEVEQDEKMGVVMKQGEALCEEAMKKQEDVTS